MEKKEEAWNHHPEKLSIQFREIHQLHPATSCGMLK
jgi:hypothetical protein